MSKQYSVTQTRHRHKMAKEAGKLHKRKIESDECKGTRNGPFFGAKITLATGLQARTSFPVTAQPAQSAQQRNGLRLRSTRSNPSYHPFLNQNLFLMHKTNHQ